MPAEPPKGTSIRVNRATVRIPASTPSATIRVASSVASPIDFMNAPDPTFTSSTRAVVPSAIFLLMIELAINGIDSTVPVTSRSAYSFRSAGAISPVAAQITAPTSRSWATIWS